MTSWVPCELLIRSPCVCSHRIRSPLAHLSSIVRPIQVDLSPPIFSLFSCPLTPWVRDLWVEGSVGWRFNPSYWGTSLSLTGWPKNINDEGHVAFTKWSLIWIEVPLHLPCRSLYINQTLPFSFLYFLLKSTIRSHSSSLLDNHTV